MDAKRSTRDLSNKRTASAFTALCIAFSSSIAHAAPENAQATGYGGVEFMGSSLITKTDIERTLDLKPGASAERINKAIQHLQSRLIKQHIKANVDIATDADGRQYVTVDVLDKGVPGVPVRKLEFLRHVDLPVELPFQYFDQLIARRETLAMQGRPVTESYDAEGRKHYSDEPLNQIAEKIHRQVVAEIPNLLTLIGSDPDPIRRSKAIEVLNWADNSPQLCAPLIPALEDSSEQVRASAARFIYPRITMLPEDFPFEDLVESLSHQLSQPDHMDRFLALRSLLKLAATYPQTTFAMKQFDEAQLKRLADTSVLTVIKQPASDLLARFAAIPAQPTAPAAPAGPRPSSGF